MQKSAAACVPCGGWLFFFSTIHPQHNRRMKLLIFVGKFHTAVILYGDILNTLKSDACVL
jgi:hypothetical protein